MQVVVVETESEPTQAADFMAQEPKQQQKPASWRTLLRLMARQPQYEPDWADDENRQEEEQQLIVDDDDEEEGVRMGLLNREEDDVDDDIGEGNSNNNIKNENLAWTWDEAAEVRFVQQEAYEREWAITRRNTTTAANKNTTTSWLTQQWYAAACMTKKKSPHSLAGTQALYWPVWVYVWLSYPFQKK